MSGGGCAFAPLAGNISAAGVSAGRVARANFSRRSTTCTTPKINRWPTKPPTSSPAWKSSQAWTLPGSRSPCCWLRGVLPRFCWPTATNGLRFWKKSRARGFIRKSHGRRSSAAARNRKKLNDLKNRLDAQQLLPEDEEAALERERETLHATCENAGEPRAGAQ